MDKEKIFFEAKRAVGEACATINTAHIKTNAWLQTAKEKYHRLSGADKIVETQLIQFNDKRLEELHYLKSSPYFVRCDVVMENENKETTLYFGKFSFSEGSIYSWVVPASAIRFENPGQVQYTRPDGRIQRAELKRKDQFMIIDGQIKFLASESLESPRELIYQDQFSNRKTGFVLPEIVAQMEKAQDQVIRAHHVGPLVISGPAGSGKTTLALHRVAYLLQSPDLETIFSGDTILVLVQDNGTKNYFSALLPGLGINNVSINTYSEWAQSILNLKVKYQMRVGASEMEMDTYEYAKLKALKSELKGIYQAENIYEILQNIYLPYFNKNQQAILNQQMKDKVLDKIDLTILLALYKKTNGSLGAARDYYEELKNGNLKKKRGFVSFDYSLIIIDEFQNYLPEQLILIKSCINKRTQSLVYVGDMAQQVQLGTIKEFKEINEDITPERKVTLQKVYRNTRNILEYIASLGYPVEIPSGIKEGVPVIEERALTPEAEISYIKRKLENKNYSSVGILAKDYHDIIKHQNIFGGDERIHVMTMNEAQGVEFDLVFLVGLKEKSFRLEHDKDELKDLIEEKKKINRDLLYVALTRAISELYILGAVGLKKAGD